MAIGAAILRQLQETVGKEHVLTSELDRFGYSYDSSPTPLVPPHNPELVVRPRTSAEVSAVMKIAFEHGIAVTPRGAASGRTGGTIPLSGGIVLTLDRHALLDDGRGRLLGARALQRRQPGPG